MKVTRLNLQDRLFFITILFFIMGMVNINLAILGLICFIVPFILYGKSGEKLWCKYYCPRAGLFTKLLGKISFRRTAPKFFYSKNMKTGVLIYFAVNMFFVMMSTIMVGLDRIMPLEHLRFLIAFEMPFTLPQIIDFEISNALTHLGYRVYSVMFTSTLIGLIIGLMYKPRNWCVICPIQTLTTKRK